MSMKDGGSRTSKAYFLMVVGLSLVAGAAFGAWTLVYRLQTNDISRQLSERVNLYEATIRQTIDRFSYLPEVLSLDPRIAALLEKPADAERAKQVNRLLEAIGVSSGGAVLYVMDKEGLTLAASNWNQPLSFVGNSYAFRPYFTEAIQHGRGTFYGVGVTTGEPGYFISARVGPQDAPLGVATVKISLAALENEWRAANEAVLLADEKGVVFLSSRRAWVYRPLTPLTAKALGQALATHQYGTADLTRGTLTTPDSDLAEGAVNIYDERGLSKEYAVMTKRLSGSDWTLAVLSNFDEASRMAGQGAALAGLTLSVIFLGGVVLIQRRATIQAKLRAHDELERRVQERTGELVETNTRLAEEVMQRISAEQHLRQTQDELIQAGKLAALGTMSAALSHEINQPLAALRTYVCSTSRLAGQGNLEAVQSNLGRIEHLLGRITDIASHLRRFARAEKGPPGRAQLGVVLHNALEMVAMRIRAEGVDVHLEGDLNLAVQGSENRLEQVFVNLFTNALDAMQDRETRRLIIRIRRGTRSISVETQDSGHGISAENQGLIFAPYFTTKEVGAGLGLGLSISHTIIQSFGGSLTVKAVPTGGAVFIVRLRSAEAEAEPLEAAE